MATYVRTHQDMDEKSMRILQRNLSFLEKECECEKLVADLYAEEIFDEDDMEKVRAEKTRMDQNKMCLSKVMHRGPKAYPALLRALDSNQQTHIADRLRQDEAIAEVAPVAKEGSFAVEDLRVDRLEGEVTHVKKRVDLLEKSSELETLQQSLQKAKEEQLSLLGRLKEMECSEKRKSEEARQLKEELGNANEEIRKLNNLIKVREDEIKSLKKDMSSQQEKLSRQEKTLKKQGTTIRSQGKMLLEQEKRLAEQEDKCKKLEERSLPPEALAFLMRQMEKERKPVAVVPPRQTYPKIPPLYKANMINPDPVSGFAREKDAANQRKKKY